jgi:hypothetical protein
MNRIVRTSDHDHATHSHAESFIPGGTTEMMGASGDDTGSLERDSEQVQMRTNHRGVPPCESD